MTIFLDINIPREDRAAIMIIHKSNYELKFVSETVELIFIQTSHNEFILSRRTRFKYHTRQDASMVYETLKLTIISLRFCFPR